MKTKALSPNLRRKQDAYWRPANDLNVRQIYSYGNPLQKKPLALAHINPHLFDHFGHDSGV
jgi:xylulose-5-phosphate/fructose-6-phosphate phosphoketolase